MVLLRQNTATYRKIYIGLWFLMDESTVVGKRGGKWHPLCQELDSERSHLLGQAGNRKSEWEGVEGFESQSLPIAAYFLH